MLMAKSAARVSALGVAVCLLLVSCAKKAPAVRNNVAGSVKLGSAPLTSGMVTLHGPDGMTATGAVLPDGNYSIDDPPLGVCQVTVTPPSGFTSPNANAGDDSHAPPESRNSPIPAKYHKPGNGLSVDVKPGATKIDIELK
jgi:hypothetical protein